MRQRRRKERLQIYSFISWLGHSLILSSSVSAPLFISAFPYIVDYENLFGLVFVIQLFVPGELILIIRF